MSLYDSEGLTQHSVDCLVELIKDKLQVYYTPFGFDVPGEVSGFSDDVSAIPLTAANSIRIWCYSAEPIRAHATLGMKDYLVSLGVYVIYSSTLDKMGIGKRRRADAMRQCISDWWPAYFNWGALEANVSYDLRYGSLRQEGGSRIGPKGKDVLTGHNKDAFALVTALVVRTQADIKFSTP